MQTREKTGPMKASPFHDPKHKQNLEKIALQTGKVLPQDVGIETSVPKNVLMAPKPSSPFGGGGGGSNPPKPSNPNGRPPLEKDTEPRKQRSEKPRSKPSVAELIIWSEKTWSTVSEVLNEAYLNSHNKKNLRQLTKAQVGELEQLKLDVFTNIDLLSETSTKHIYDILLANKKMDIDFKNILNDHNISIDSMSMENYRRNIIGLFVQQKTA
jgi:hypothetical protein